MKSRPPVQGWARHKGLEFFQPQLAHRVLCVGSGSRWVRYALSAASHADYTGGDLQSPADFEGDINQSRTLGRNPWTRIGAFKWVEHGTGFEAGRQILRLGLNQCQPRPHDHRFDLHAVPGFRPESIRTNLGGVPWAVFTKEDPAGIETHSQKNLPEGEGFAILCL